MSESDPSQIPTSKRSAIARPAILIAVLGVLLSGGAFMMASHATADPTPTMIQVYKTPTCGCCTLWIDHLRASGFEVKATDLPDLSTLKAMNGVPNELSSCHTATIDGYVIEGHVPASDITRLLAERPKIAGLAVPGMPMGSPGMEHPDPRRHEAYDVIAFGGQGGGSKRDTRTVFSSHRP